MESTVGEEPRRRLGPAGRILVLLTVLALVAIPLIWLLNPPRYRATALIHVGSPFPRLPFELIEPPVPLDVRKAYVKDQAMLAGDESVLREVLRDNAVVSTGWFRSHPGGFEALEDLKSKWNARPLEGCVELSFQAEDPKDAATIVNTVAVKYLSAVQRSVRSAYADELKSYRQLEEQLRKSLHDILARKQRFAMEFGDTSFEESRVWLASEANRLEQEKLRAKARYDTLTTRPAGSSPDLEQWIALQEDPLMVSLLQQKLATEIEIEQSGPETPENQAAKRKLSILERKVEEQTARRLRELQEVQRNAAQDAYLQALQLELQARERLVELDARHRDADRTMTGLGTLDDEQRRLQEQLDRVRRHAGELEMILRDQNPAGIRLVAHAQPPDEKEMRFQITSTLIAAGVPVVFGLIWLLVRFIR